MAVTGEKIIGIDLGTTNSVVSIMEGGEVKVILANLGAIVVVDRARRVQARYAVLQREARARTDLNLVSIRNGNCEAGRNRVPLPGSKGDVFRRQDIEAGCALSRICWRRQTLAVR